MFEAAAEGWDADSELEASCDWIVRGECVYWVCDSREERLVRVVSGDCVLVVILHQGLEAVVDGFGRLRLLLHQRFC